MKIAGLPIGGDPLSSTVASRWHTPDESQYLNCVRCGLCLSVCPTYQASLNETASPRGRVALTRQGLEGKLKLSHNLFDQMYSCFACTACNFVCPVGINPSNLVLKMRDLHERIWPSGWKKVVFGRLIPGPEYMEMVSMPLRLYEMVGLCRIVYTLGRWGLLPVQLRDTEAMLPRLPRRPLRQMLPGVTEAIGESRYRIGFFLGCAQSLLFGRQSAATVRVLARNGCIVIAPKKIVCCGMPSAGYGRPDLMEKQARHNIALFEQADVDVIVTDCATCGSTLKNYGRLLEGDPDWAERARAFSQKVRDVNEFLVSIPLEKPRGHIEGRVTYHDPCHLRRGQGVWLQPRALLKMIDGLEFIELPEADWCCGSAGSQLVTHYDTSLKVLGRKMDHLEGVRADYVASGCPGCQMQLNVGVRRRGLTLRVVHPVELLDRAYHEMR